MRYVPFVVLLLAASVFAKGVKRKEPGPRAKGQRYEWTSEGGIAFYYFVPKGYDPEKGANLTLILHGSNLSRMWGFANHGAGKFRPDDVVVSPDGTTSNGRGGFNFLPKDAGRFAEFVRELKSTFKVRQTFLYGHSQGSFFAFLFAAAHPDEVDGVVGHASGIWGGETPLGTHGHHQAIVLMHGTQDPVVAYFQSVWSLRDFERAEYPMVRLRSLEGWNHWPAEHNGPIPHTSRQLAWCEGMTTKDMGRLEACFEFLCDNKSKERHDYAAVYGVARRILALEGTPKKLQQRATRATAAVEELARAHVKALKVPEGAAFERKPWVGHLPMFLRSFVGVPAREEFARQWKEVLDAQEKGAEAQLERHWRAMQGQKTAEAFAAGVAALKCGFLYHRCTNREFLNRLAGWKDDAKKLGLEKGALKDYDSIVPDLERALKDGTRAFDGVNRKAPKLG